MCLSLSEVVIEQAQLVAELLASGELKLKESVDSLKEETAPLVNQGIKIKKDFSINLSSSESHQDEAEEHKKKKIKLSNSLDDEARSSSTSVSNRTAESIKVKGVVLSTDIASKIKAASPLHYFLSTITSVASTKSEPLSLTFADLLDPSLGILKESIQINFMVELGWLLAQYCAHKVQ